MDNTVSDWTILLCTDYLPPEGGGVEVVVEKLACQLADQGANVSIFTLGSGEESSRLNKTNITVYRASTLDITGVVGLQSQLSPDSLVQLRNVIKRVEPDLVHVHNRFFFTSLTAATLRSIRQLNQPLLTTLHLGKIDEIRGISGRAARIYEQTLGRGIISQSDALVTVSEAVAEHSQSIGGEPASTYVIPNGVDPYEFAPSESSDGDLRVLFVGRLVKNKGPQVLIEAIPEIVETYPDVKFELIGRGPLEESLRKRVNELGLEETVIFSGYVESVSAAMQGANIFCRPSSSEGMPLTLLEAMASGLPTVVTPVAGVPEVVKDRETGWLIPPQEPNEVAEALVKLLDDPQLRNTIGAAAREYVVEEHSWERRTERIKEVYRTMMSE